MAYQTVPFPMMLTEF